MKNIDDYKTKYTYEQRLEQSSKIIRKYEARIPVLVFSKDVILNKFKFLVPSDLSFSQFVYIVRQKIENIKENEALYFFIKDKLISPNTSMIQLYDEYRDDDNHIYITITKETTFGII
jgi:GABA(A) receptor-associated protein